MREAHEGGDGMSVQWGRPPGLPLAFLLAFSPCAFAAITGQVLNQTTGKPQASATVALYKLGTQNGLEMIDQAKSDAAGQFTINQEVRGPHLIRTAFDGVTYNHMLPPGQPTTGLTLEVFNASKQPGAAKVGKHMILFEPGGGQMTVNETYLLTNSGKTAWNDPDTGTLHFYLPEGTGGRVQVQATAPGGMPLGTPVKKTAKADVFAADFAVKPGETRFDLTYAVPYTEGAAFAGKVVTKDDNTYLIVPNGVTLKSDNVNDLGTEPRTQAHIFGLTATSYSVQLTGATVAAPPEAGGDSDGSPKIEQIMPRVFGQAKWIVALSLGILALGFALLYRAPNRDPNRPPAGNPVKESHERSRR
jgi:hypothetical protein